MTLEIMTALSSTGERMWLQRRFSTISFCSWAEWRQEVYHQQHGRSSGFRSTLAGQSSLFFVIVIHFYCSPEEACWKLIWAGQQSITPLPGDPQFNPNSAQCNSVYTNTPTHIPLCCLSIARGKDYWPISEFNVPTSPPPGMLLHLLHPLLL